MIKASVSCISHTEVLIVGSSLKAFCRALDESKHHQVTLIGTLPFPAGELTSRWDFGLVSWNMISCLKQLPIHGRYPYPAAVKHTLLETLEQARVRFISNMYFVCQTKKHIVFAGAGKLWMITADKIIYEPLASATWKNKIIRWTTSEEKPDWLWNDKGIIISDYTNEAIRLAVADSQEDYSHVKLKGTNLPAGCKLHSIKGDCMIEIPDITVCPEIFDVITVGGGTAGTASAIAAAREGGKVLLLERFSDLGGLSTNGRITNHYNGNRVGFAAEVDKVCADEPQHKFNEYDGSWQVEAKKKALLSMAKKAGIQILFHQECCGVLKKGSQVCGILSVSSDGPRIYLGKVIIDATGNADIAAAAGARCQFLDDEPALQGTGVPALVPGEENSNSDFTFTSNQNPMDINRTLYLASEIFKDKFDFGPMIDTRERRRIKAIHTVVPEDIYAHRQFKDCIVRCFSRFDTHGFMTDRCFELNAPSTEAIYVELPYRALLPEKLEGILVTGLGIGASRDAMPFIRMQPDVLNQGYASGVAAMVSVHTHKSLRNISIRTLQKKLIVIGILPPEYAHHQSKIPVVTPMPQDVQNIHECVGAILLNPPKYMKELQRRCQASHDLRYAQLLAIMENDAGAELLAKEVASYPFAKDIPGWNYKGMGQSGRCASRIDSIIHSLARLKKDYASEAVLIRLDELTAESYFSHFRSICYYLMKHPNVAAVPKLQKLLKCLQQCPVKVSIDPLDTLYRNWRLKCFYAACALLSCKNNDNSALDFLLECQRRNEGGFTECAKQLLKKISQKQKKKGKEL